MLEQRRVTLTGWGRTAPSRSVLVDATTDSLSELLAQVRTSSSGRGLVARGLGRSYGDPAQNAGGIVLAPLPDHVSMDADNPGGPRVRVSAGTSLHELIRALLPTGHFVPVSPGTRFVTVGGAIAADVHGKNHHRNGSLAAHVESLELLTSDGTVRTVGPEREPELFWATTGGMGLTGIVLSAVLRVRKVESGWMVVRTERLPDLRSVMERMQEADATSTYSVAWIDTTARGAALGRSVLTLGEHATLGDVEGRKRDRWALPRSPRLRVPPAIPVNLVSRPAVRLFNEAWFRRAPRLREHELQTAAAFFHPLDAVADWNRAYGPRGVVQYQLVVPDGAEAGLRSAVGLLADAGHPSFLSVLKRFGPGTPGPLSFPVQGWTLAVDLAARPGIGPLLQRLDDLVVDHGGRIYLAKDSRATPQTIEKMYPALDDFRRVRAAVDPDRLFRSDLSRRLEL